MIGKSNVRKSIAFPLKVKSEGTKHASDIKSVVERENIYSYLDHLVLEQMMLSPITKYFIFQFMTHDTQSLTLISSFVYPQLQVTRTQS